MGQASRAVRNAALEMARPLVSGHVVLLTGNAATSQGMEDFFADAGAAAVHRLVLPEAAGPLASRLAAGEQLLADPPAALVRRVDDLDRDGRGLVYAGSYTAVRNFCGRRVLGYRLESHFAAERKDVQYRLLGVATSDRQLLRIENHTDVRQAIIEQVAHGPAVIQGVPRGLLAIGVSHTYLLPVDASRSRISQMLDRITEDCADIILAPLNTGLPCTYYGFLTSDHVIDFGPSRLLPTGIVVAGVSTRPGSFAPYKSATRRLPPARLSGQRHAGCSSGSTMPAHSAPTVSSRPIHIPSTKSTRESVRASRYWITSAMTLSRSPPSTW